MNSYKHQLFRKRLTCRKVIARQSPCSGKARVEVAVGAVGVASDTGMESSDEFDSCSEADDEAKDEVVGAGRRRPLSQHS